MEATCKNFEKCPIYSGILKDRNSTAQGYKKQFCEAGETGWSKCKRFLVKEATGKCPADLLPNSIKSVEDIILAMS